MAYESDLNQEPQERRGGLGSRLWGRIKRAVTSRATRKLGVYMMIGAVLLSLFPPTAVVGGPLFFAGLGVVSVSLLARYGSAHAREASESAAKFKGTRGGEEGNGLPYQGYAGQHSTRQPHQGNPEQYPSLGQSPHAPPQGVHLYGPREAAAPGVASTSSVPAGGLPVVFRSDQPQWQRSAQAPSEPTAQVPPATNLGGGALAGAAAGLQSEEWSSTPLQSPIPRRPLTNNVLQFNPDSSSASRPSSPSSERTTSPVPPPPRRQGRPVK